MFQQSHKHLSKHEELTTKNDTRKLGKKKKKLLIFND